MRSWWLAGLPGVLSLRAFGAGAPLVLYLAVVLHLRVPEVSVVTWLSLATASYLVVAAVAVTLQRPVEQLPPSPQRLVAAALLLSVGPVAALLTLVLAVAAGAYTLALDGILATGDAVVLSAWLLAGGRISSLLDKDSEVRQRMLTQLAREKALATDSQRLLEEDIRNIAQELEVKVSGEIEVLSHREPDGRRLSLELKRVISESVRPVSHELNNSRISDDDVLSSFADMRVPSGAPLRAFLTSPTGAGDLVLAMVLLVAAGLSVIPISRISPVYVVFPLTYSFAIGLLLIAASARSRLTREDLDEVLARTEHTASLVRQSIWVARRRLANIVHGDLQARILVSSLRVSDADDIDVKDEIRRLSSDLAQILTPQPESQEWRIALDRLVSMWRFTIDVHSHVSQEANDAMNADGIAGTALVAVAGEAVTNAVRHGDADTITITVQVPTDHAGVIRAVITDNGPQSPNGAAGMGSALLDATALSWSFRFTGEGHEVEVLLPIRT